MSSSLRDLGDLPSCGRRTARRGARRAASTLGAGLLLGLLQGVALAPPAAALTLDEAVAAAEQHSVDLQLVQEQTTQAQAQVGQAWSLIGPKVVVGANYTINKDEIVLDFADQIPEEFQSFFEGSEPTVIQARNYADANASVIQPLFSAESVPLMRGAYALRDAQELTEDGVRLQVRVGAAQAYYGLVVSREGVKIAEEALQNAQRHHALAQRQVQAGLAPPLAEKQGELAVSRAERGLREAQERLATAELGFELLTGLSPDVEASLPPPPQVGVASLEEAVDRALAQRPDLQAAALQAHAAQLQHQADVLGWLPDVQARLTGTWTQNLGFQGEPTWWLFVVSATWTAWDGGYRVGTNRATASQARMADLSVQRSTDLARQEVTLAWEAYQRAESALTAVEREVVLAKETARLAELGLASGSVSVVDAEDARLGVVAAELTLLAERMTRDLAVLRLSAAMGEWAL